MINILYTVDNNFVPQLATNICSCCHNAGESDRLHFYVFSKGVSQDNRDTLQDFVASLDQVIDFIDIDNFTDRLGFEFDTSGWNEIVLARLLMASFLPDFLDRILYLDGDTLVRSSLSSLWDTDLRGNTLGMVMEPTANRCRLEELGIASYPYFNAGVMLVDLSAWRARKTERRLLDYCASNNGRLFANDQDAINYVLRDEIYTLSPAYDYANSFDIYPYRLLKKQMPKFVSERTFDDAKANPVIVHFLGEDRPWRKGNTHRFSDEYHGYLAMTPWSSSQDETGWERYFTCWRLFNTFTKPFPGLRLHIINALIPAMLRWRSRR